MLVEAVVDEAEVAVIRAGADGADHVEFGVARFARQLARTLNELLAKSAVLALVPLLCKPEARPYTCTSRIIASSEDTGSTSG